MGKLKKLRNPEIFQGSKKKKSYFEGWYFKLVNHDASKIYAFIPGIALDKKNNTSHSFIQFFDGINEEYFYFRYGVDEFLPSEDEFRVTVGKSHFSSKDVHIDIEQQGKKIFGDLKLIDIVPWPSSLLSPGIMGIFSYFPMQTNHGIVSMNHGIEGKLTVDGIGASFEERSKGYIEKDWGTSFPSSWIWMQSNHFSEPELSFLFSVATIPVLGKKFRGYLSAIWHKGNFYSFATYTRAKLRKVKIEGQKAYIITEDKKNRLEIEAIQENPTDMKAPSLGEMTAHCFESLTSTLHVKLIDKKTDNIIFDDTGVNAGIELMDDEELQKE